MVDERQMKHVLEMLASGATCDHQIIRGGILVLDSANNTHERVDVKTFFALKEQHLISEQSTTRNYHAIFRPSSSNQVVMYGITESGREYLEK